MLKKSKTRVILLSLVLVGLSISFISIYLRTDTPIDRVHLADEETLRIQVEPLSIQTRLLIGGDIFLGRSVEKLSLLSDLKYDYPFQNFETLGLNNYNAVIANLECPSTSTIISFEAQATYLTFNCLPDFLPSLAKYVDIVSLANNHTDNVGGLSGLQETRGNLDINSFQYFGHYDNSQLDELCEVVTVEGLILYDNFDIGETMLPIALCGYHGVFAIPLDGELEVIKQYSKYLPTIVMPHMGAEYVTSSDSIRERVYRKMIDNGADVVAGGHPHWVQNTEVYRDKLIIYSMGNLIFDQQANIEVQRSLMLDLNLEIDFNDNTAAWIDLAEGCALFGDNCIDQAESLGLDKLEAKFRHDIKGTVLENMVVRQANTVEQKAIEVRANWALTSSKLSTN